MKRYTSPWEFSDHPGTVGWKFGYRLLRDQPKNGLDEDEFCLSNSQLRATVRPQSPVHVPVRAVRTCAWQSRSHLSMT